MTDDDYFFLSLEVTFCMSVMKPFADASYSIALNKKIAKEIGKTVFFRFCIIFPIKISHMKERSLMQSLMIDHNLVGSKTSLKFL